MSEKNCIFTRVSTRSYQDRPVEDENIELMLRAAMAAPSARDQRPWFIYAVTNKEMIQKLSEATPNAKCIGSAPLVFAACYLRDTFRPVYSQIDMSAAVENILLEATELGIGSVWIGVAPYEDRMENVRNILGVPEDKIPFALIGCGYPAKGAFRAQQDRFDESRIEFVR